MLCGRRLVLLVLLVCLAVYLWFYWCEMVAPCDLKRTSTPAMAANKQKPRNLTASFELKHATLENATKATHLQFSHLVNKLRNSETKVNSSNLHKFPNNTRLYRRKSLFEITGMVRAIYMYSSLHYFSLSFDIIGLSMSVQVQKMYVMTSTHASCVVCTVSNCASTYSSVFVACFPLLHIVCCFFFF